MLGMSSCSTCQAPGDPLQAVRTIQPDVSCELLDCIFPLDFAGQALLPALDRVACCLPTQLPEPCRAVLLW